MDKPESRFPIIIERGAKPHPMTISWQTAEMAYSVYAARYGKNQSLERMMQRGGFYPSEMDDYVPDWRERESELTALREAQARLTEENQKRTEQLKAALLDAWEANTSYASLLNRFAQAEADVARLTQERDGAEDAARVYQEQVSTSERVLYAAEARLQAVEQENRELKEACTIARLALISK